MAKLKIITEGHPILRKKALPIAALDKKTEKLAADMMETMNKENGIGLAAPQVGQSRRMICVKAKEGNLVFINPLILKKSWRKTTAEEGCLSVPGIFGLVKRYNNIVLRAQSLDKETVKFKAKGLMARVIQHEIDHLEGILFTDKIEKKASGKKDARKI
jgi:peptide deformylase